VLGHTGTAHLPLTVLNYRSSDLQLSPIVLGAAGQITHADAAIGLDRARGLVPFQPSTTRTFTSHEALRIYLTGAWRSPATALEVEVSISGGSAPRIRRFTAQATVAVGGRRQADVDTVVPLADLAPGSYVLRVEARVPKGKPVSREIPLDIR
jgi:hypothetical protein